MTRPDLRSAGLLLACACAVPVAGALEVRPSIEVTAVYTSNLTLSPGNDIDPLNPKVDDVVTRVDPRIDISHKSPRIDLRGDYTYSYLRYSETSESDASFSAGGAALDLTLIKDLLTLESFVDQSRQLINPEFSPVTEVSIVDGRTDQTVLETSPHLQTTVFGVGIDMRYMRGTIDFNFDTPVVEDSDQPEETQNVAYREAHTAITSEEQNRGLAWGLFHDYEVYKYKTGSDNKAERAYLTLTYGLRQAGDLFIFGSAGRENDYRDFKTGRLVDSYLELGIRRTTARNLVEVSFRDRSFGSALNGKIRRELNKGSIELAYREDPSVQESLFEQRTTNPALPPPGGPDDLDPPGTGDRFVYRVLSLTLLKELGRNKIEVVAFNEEREDIIDRDPQPGDPPNPETSEYQVGVKGEAVRQVGPRTTAGLEGKIVNREFKDDNDDQLSTIRLVGTYALGRRLTLEGWLAHHQQRGSNDLKFNYEEFQAGMSANYSFR